MKAIKTIAVFALLLGATPLFGERLRGTGPLEQLPGQPRPEPQITDEDIAKAMPGDSYWREVSGLRWWYTDWEDPATKKRWGWYNLTQEDIDAARARLKPQGFMAGFKPALPDIDASGESYMEYRKSDTHSRKLFEGGAIEDVVTNYPEFMEALAQFREYYSEKIPRRNGKIAEATNWYFVDKVPKNFPTTFWASITIEGRIMKVIIANSPDIRYRIAVSYWATPDFMAQYPNTTWSWRGADPKHTRTARRIQEDISQTAKIFEYGSQGKLE